MAKIVERDEVRRLIESGAQIVDVLPADEYRESHLPGALSIPLKELSRDRALRDLDPQRPVVVYCYDST